MGVDAVTLSLAKTYANKLSCGIANSTYDPATSTMTVNLNDGSSYDVTFDDGVTTQDRLVLDNIAYDRTNDTLKVNGVEVLTKDDAVGDDDDIDFGDMFP